MFKNKFQALSCLLVGGLLLCWTPEVSAQSKYDFLNITPYLASIKSVGVVVEVLDPRLSTQITDECIKTAIELQLLKAGMKVEDNAGGPYLYINCQFMPIDEIGSSRISRYSMDISTDLRDYAIPVDAFTRLVRRTRTKDASLDTVLTEAASVKSQIPVP